MTDNANADLKDERPVHLILMAGYPGVGKSAIAAELAKTLKIPLIDIDDIRSEVDRRSGIDDWETRGRLAYDILKGLVSRQVTLGVSVIADTPLTHQWLRDFMFGITNNCGAKVHVVHCLCPDAVAIERNRTRHAEDPRKYAYRDVENFHRIRGLFEPIEHIARICVDTEEPVADNVSRILQYLNLTGNVI